MHHSHRDSTACWGRRKALYPHLPPSHRGKEVRQHCQESDEEEETDGCQREKGMIEIFRPLLASFMSNFKLLLDKDILNFYQILYIWIASLDIISFKPLT